MEELFNSAIDHHARGQLQQAETLYKKILKKQPDHPDVLHLIGLVEYQLGKFESAIKFIEKAINVNPDVPDYYNNCGEAYRASKR